MATATTTKSEPTLREPEGIWSHAFSYHPFTPVLERAEGIYLYDTDGNRYIDASGGPLAINIGHGDFRVITAMNEQAKKFTYCHPVLSNEPRAELCRDIAEVAPGDLNTTYLVSGGSEAVDTAIKLARQYHLLTGNVEKHIVISLWDAYHGMTLGALSATGLPGSRKPFNALIQQWPHIRQVSAFGRPEGVSEVEYALSRAQELEEAIHNVGAEHVAAFIATPIGGGADYGLIAPPQYWRRIREICDRYDVLFIADEVVTGFGRTGKWFGMEHHGVQADMMITAKGISSLYAPLGAVTVSDRVNQPFLDGGYFVHGFTNMGHPVACAAGRKVIEILRDDGLVQQSEEIGAYLHAQRDRLLSHPTVADVRGKGLLMVLELVKDKKSMEFFGPEVNAERKFQTTGLNNGLALYATLYGARRPVTHRRGQPVFIFPPLCISRAQVDELIGALDATLTEWERELGV